VLYTHGSGRDAPLSVRKCSVYEERRKREESGDEEDEEELS
jgi:hypothetical protein